MKFEFSIDIPAPRELVWQIAQDTAPRPDWDVRVSKYTVHGTAAVGTPLTIIFRVPMLRPVGKGQFVRFDPPFQSAIRIDTVAPGWIPPGGGTWIFEEIAEGTRMTTRFNLKENSPGAAPEWMLKLGANIDTYRSLRRLRKKIAISMKTRKLQHS